MPKQEHVAEVLRTRAGHIEKFAAAFLLEVGSEEASKYQLIETQDLSDPNKMRITWQFLIMPDTTDNPIQGVIDAMATLDKQISEIGHAAIVKQLAPIFEARQDIQSIRWNQSTPYFNDGDPCTFGLGEIYLDLGKMTQEEIDDEGLGDDEAYSTEYDLNPHGDKPYDDPRYKEGQAAVKELMAPFNSIPETLMERIFGNNKQIVITREGEVTVEDYEPGC